MISLYIADQLVDLDESSFILYNYTREELSNPTIVRNSFSKEITIPGTSANNQLFGHVFRSDRQTISGRGVGAEFDAMRKIDFVIYSSDGSIIERGYVRLNGIIKDGNNIRYRINLFGGLGSFFYALTYNDDGSKKTLADLHYELDGEIIDPHNYEFSMMPISIKSAWEGLEEAMGTFPIKSIHGIINYMPAYNGYPDKFDANKVYYKPYSKYRNCPNLYVSKDGFTTHPDGGGGILVEMKNNHNEWEMQDLRDYLQRPVIRFIAILDAITHTTFGGYTFVIDESCNIKTPAVVETTNLWMTLPLIDWDVYHDVLDRFPLSALLENTLSPAEYLISYAKMMGHVFVTDSVNKRITMMPRSQFFNMRSDVIDLSDRIDVNSIDVTPCTPKSKYYVFETENYGEEAKKYEERYRQKYGSQVVNTGYEFETEPIKVLQNYAFKGACDVMERSLNYRIYGGDADEEYGSYYNYLFKFAFTEEVSWKLYKSVDGKLESETFTPSKGWIARFGYSKDRINDDMFPKIQLHGSDNKMEDGSNVLVVFNRMVEPTYYTAGGNIGLASVDFYLTSDTQEMLNLNGGKPCWNYYRDNTALSVNVLPSFRRSYINKDYNINKGSVDFGAPKEVYVKDYDYTDLESQQNHIYDKRWKYYFHDLYDVNTKIMKCKVNLRGLQVNDALLGCLFWFNNTLWTINKISNHSMTTDDLTECEFVKVKDIKNYTNGQKY